MRQGVSSGASGRIWTLSEDLLLGQGWHAETGIGHAPVYRSGREMFSDLAQSSSFSRLGDLQKSAVVFFDGQTLRVHKLETEEGGGGERDVPRALHLAGRKLPATSGVMHRSSMPSSPSRSGSFGCGWVACRTRNSPSA